MDLLIDADLRTHIPPLTSEERGELERSLVNEGCRDALIVWREKGILIDGHNRYDICTKHNIPFRTFEKTFADRDAVMDWMDANQLARRNLNPEQMSLLRGRRYNRAKQPHGGQLPKGITQNEVSVQTSQKLASQYGVSRATIERDAQFATAVEEIEPYVPDITQRVLTGQVVKKTVIEAAKTPEKAPEIIGVKPHVSYNSGENEWYTPICYIESARKVMGSIDTDPASSDIANGIVKAKQYYTVKEDGRAQKWQGNVWMNPPYSQPLITEFTGVLVNKFNSGEITQACVLVNNATETNFYQNLLSASAAICFIKGRVKFLDKFGNSNGAPLQGQTILYLGNNQEEFANEFLQYGVILYAGG